MMQTINPYTADRTAEIMSRYRPIAPKPEIPNPNPMSDGDNSSAIANGIRESLYLRTVWARPTRTRKRGRTATLSPPSSKRDRGGLQGLIPPSVYRHLTNPPVRNQLVQGHSANVNLVPIKWCLDTAVTSLADFVELPLLRVAPGGKEKGIDLNLSAAPEELDLLSEPVWATVVSPRPVRPVCSSVVVERITEDLRRRAAARDAEEVEEMVEAEQAPAIVSDSSNRVRMCNAAYKELVGQPECGWLDCAVGGACRRIGGGMWLRFEGSKVERSMQGFSGRVRIEWEREGVKKCVRAFCEGVKVGCEAKDYQFLWRFYGFKSGVEDSDD